MEVNRRMFELMQEKRLTQIQLARSVGVSIKTVNTWKQRGTNPPSEYIAAIAEFLRVSCLYLLTGREDGSPPLDPEALELARDWQRLDIRSKRIVQGEIYKRLGAREGLCPTRTEPPQSE